MTQLLTNSRASCFRECPRKHQLRYEFGIAPEQESLALRVGTAFHWLQEAVDCGMNPDDAVEKMQDLDPYERALVAAMFITHREHWQNEAPHEVVETELPFELPLRNPDTGAPSKLWNRAGVIDRVYRVGSQLVVKDYKTTTEDISPGSDFWARLQISQQMSIYVDAARELGYDVSSIFYDVTVRPTHSPKMATPEADRKYTTKASKLKDGTVRPAGSLYAGQREVDETPEEFCARVADAMRAEPSRYFARHEIAKLDSDLDDVRYEQWTMQMVIRECQRSGRWWRNPNACLTIGRKCEYLGICHLNLTKDSPAPNEFRKLDDVHPELTRT